MADYEDAGVRRVAGCLIGALGLGMALVGGVIFLAKQGPMPALAVCVLGGLVGRLIPVRKKQTGRRDPVLAALGAGIGVFVYGAVKSALPELLPGLIAFAGVMLVVLVARSPRSR